MMRVLAFSYQCSSRNLVPEVQGWLRKLPALEDHMLIWGKVPREPHLQRRHHQRVCAPSDEGLRIHRQDINPGAQVQLHVVLLVLLPLIHVLVPKERRVRALALDAQPQTAPRLTPSLEDRLLEDRVVSEEVMEAAGVW